MTCKLGDTMTSVLHELLAHKTWATLRVIELCQTLGTERLDASIPGTYGTLRATLAHLVNADHGYHRRLTGMELGPPLDEQSASLDAISERFRSLATRWPALFDDPSAPDREIQTQYGSTRGVVVMAQSIHHADDHRTQVLSILGAIGVDLPEFDVWEHAREVGLSQTVAEAPTA
jgi:uncharacterized damage-inducible protein DinB